MDAEPVSDLSHLAISAAALAECSGGGGGPISEDGGAGILASRGCTATNVGDGVLQPVIGRPSASHSTIDQVRQALLFNLILQGRDRGFGFSGQGATLSLGQQAAACSLLELRLLFQALAHQVINLVSVPGHQRGRGRRQGQRAANPAVGHGDHAETSMRASASSALR